MTDRLFPTRPILAVSVAVFRNRRALIVRRAREPMLGRFTLPGGVVEVGETMAEAALRELAEETGVRAEIVAFNRHVESIDRLDERVRAHFVIASFVARWVSGEGRASDETDAVRWIEPEAADAYLTTPELGDVLLSAAKLAGDSRSPRR